MGGVTDESPVEAQGKGGIPSRRRVGRVGRDGMGKTQRRLWLRLTSRLRPSSVMAVGPRL